MTLTPKRTGFEIRLRFGKGQRDRFTLSTLDEALALALEPRMEAMAKRFADATSDKAREQAHGLLKEACLVASDPKKFAAVERVVSKLCAEAAADTPPAVASAPSTFRDVAELWTSGKLTELYPDHDRCPPKDAQARKEDQGIVSTFFPALGAKPIAALAHEDIDAARRLIPKDLHPNTRRIYVVKLRFVLRLAESPLRIVERAVQVDVPKRKPSNLFGYLYPQEEAQLLGCQGIPLVYRMLYGYLARNGCRVGESLQLTWDHIDLETGDIHIDKRWTKTRVARKWVLDPDVLAAFAIYHRVLGKPEGLVFTGRTRKAIRAGTIWARFIKDLREAGVTRKSILDGADGINPIRVHDLRASFVTLSLRGKRDLKWIMTRTGHETLGVLKGYDRLVQDAEEHRLATWFDPMDRAIPELRTTALGGPTAGPMVGQPTKTLGVSGPFRSFITEPRSEESQAKTSGKTLVAPAETPLWPTSGPAEFKGVGQVGPPLSTEVEVVPSSVGGVGQVLDTCPEERNPSPSAPPEPAESVVDRALASALAAAQQAQQWDLCQEIVRELSERRRARLAPGVTSLSDARKKREEKP
jgi:integrase